MCDKNGKNYFAGLNSKCWPFRYRNFHVFLSNHGGLQVYETSTILKMDLEFFNSVHEHTCIFSCWRGPLYISSGLKNDRCRQMKSRKPSFWNKCQESFFSWTQTELAFWSAHHKLILNFSVHIGSVLKNKTEKIW